jgi:tetratricopeptide (TPR) repeat protein
MGLNRQCRFKESVEEYERALPLMRQVVGPGRLSFSLTGYGHSLCQLGRYAEAETVLREAITIREDDLGLTSPQFFNSRSILSEVLIGQKNYKEAGEHLLTAYKGQTQPLDEALSRLAAKHPMQAELVQLRYFGGLTLDECAEALGVSARTADTWWSYARAWLSVELTKA